MKRMNVIKASDAKQVGYKKKISNNKAMQSRIHKRQSLEEQTDA